MTESDIDRLYYSIGEVSRLLELDQHVLRYWETEFSQLRPKKSSAGNRQYKKNDLELLRRIKWLLYDEKHTIEGARQKLRLPVSSDSAEDKTAKEQELMDRLVETRQGLLEIIDIINRRS